MKNERKLSIRIAGNTQNPALNILKEKGYRLWIEPDLPGEESELIDWNAEKDGRYFSATSPGELLGLVVMQEYRGDDWFQKEDEPDIVDALIAEAARIEEKLEIKSYFDIRPENDWSQFERNAELADAIYDVGFKNVNSEGKG